jgi:hypothetical protein
MGMTTVIPSDGASKRALVDVLVESYVRWREECLAVRLAYRFWADCERGERRLAYAGYVAALDREDHAACVYAEEIRWIRRLCA